jgi:hypothetical protein
VLRGMPVTNGLVFENQTILPDWSARPITNLEDEPRWFPSHRDVSGSCK